MRRHSTRRTKKMRRHHTRKNKIGGMPTGKKTTTHKTHKRNTPHKTHASKTRTTSLHPKSQSQSQSQSQSMDNYFLNGTQSSEEKSQIIGIVSSAGLSQNTQDNIFNSIGQGATADDVKQEVDEYVRVTQSPFIEIDGNKSLEETKSYQEVVTWGNHHPSITKETLDASMPEPLSLSELKSATPDLESQQVKPTTLFELVQSSFKNKYEYDLSPEELTLLDALTSENYLEMHQMFDSFFETKKKEDEFELLDPSNFDIVVLVHGQTDPHSPPIDMNYFSNIEMHMVVPETIVVNVEFNPNPKHGERGYDDIINKAFNNDLFVFNKYGKDNARMCPSMLQGVSNLDTAVTKDAMGFYMRLDDGTLFKIADFNCTYKYEEFDILKPSMHPDDINMRFNYSLIFISKLARLISNILKGAHSEETAGTQPLLKITQLSCRPYLVDTEISPNIKNIWTALLMLGNTNVAIMDGYVTLNTNAGSDFVSKGHSLSPQYSASQSASVRQQPDEQSKLDYVVEKIKSIASRILRIKTYSGIKEHVKTRQKIKIIHQLIRYIKMINFEFAKRGLPVPDGATMISTLDDRDEYPDEFWLKDKPYTIGPIVSPLPSASQSSLKDAKDCEWDDCEPSQEIRIHVSSQGVAAAAAKSPTIKQAWPENPPSPIHPQETGSEQKYPRNNKKQRTKFKFLPEEPGAYLGSSSSSSSANTL